MNFPYTYALCCCCAFFFLMSCSKELPETENRPFEAYELGIQAETVSDLVDDIVEASILALEGQSEGEGAYVGGRFYEGAIITTRTEASNYDITLDFGEGGQLGNGVRVSGKLWYIYVPYTGSPARAKVFVGFEQFYINGLLVGGMKIINRTWGTTVAGMAPVSETESDLDVYPEGDIDGQKITVKGITSRSWLQGYSSDDWKDNVVLKSGDYELVLMEGPDIMASYEVTISGELLHSWLCLNAISGETVLQDEQNSAVIDYGKGACDNKAVLKVSGGESREITLF